ncbi:MAG: hypothetical protein LBB28_05670 [Synergistaceae bacterium]|jgi:hypothetical protein|nr:hypothetical protein [Synergistaceae bacterium]
MREPCCDISTKSKQPELASHLLELFARTSEEIEAELETIKSCPSPCDDGTVLLPGLSRRVSCPVSSPACAFGLRVTGELEKYMNGIMIEIGVPRRHIENFSGHRESYAVLEANDWLFRGFLVICGRTGSGKSFAAARVVYRYLESRITDRLKQSAWRAAQIAGESVSWQGAKEISDDRDISARAIGASLLVIDDLGREDGAKTTRAALCSAVSRRYDAKLATVITTEFSMGDIRRRYGRFFTDRLTEDAGNGGNVVDCGNV